MRIKKFVASVNEITPKATYSEREVQCELMMMRDDQIGDAEPPHQLLREGGSLA